MYRTTLERVDVPGLDPDRERAFRLDDNRIAKVRVARREIPERSQPRDNRFIALALSASLVDPEGDPVEIAGQECRTPTNVVSISVEAISEGRISIENERARVTALAVERLERCIESLEFWSAIPAEEG